jgi:hypothetical protein
MLLAANNHGLAGGSDGGAAPTIPPGAPEAYWLAPGLAGAGARM